MPNEKITEYLLDLTHGSGGPKAAFFVRFGFTLEDPEPFRRALLLHARQREVVSTRRTEFAVNYRLRCALETPDGRTPCIASVWKIVSSGAAPQLVTAFPD